MNQVRGKQSKMRSEQYEPNEIKEEAKQREDMSPSPKVTHRS